MLSNLINGISLGSVYAIIALGYTMVYGIAKMLNFAHGDIIMVGGYVAFCTNYYLGWHALPCVSCWQSSSAPCWASSLSGWHTSLCAPPVLWPC